MEKNSSGTVGMGFTGTLTIVFITLKLIGVIDWGWAWVLSPIWISAILTIGIFMVALIVGLIIKAVRCF